MERRKVQRFGPSSLCISLPKDWTQSVDVKAGDAVYVVQEQDGTLKIITRSATDELALKEYSIDCDHIDTTSLLERLIVAIYMMGVDTITITSSRRLKSHTLEAIRTIVRTLFGANLTEETANAVVIDHFIDPAKFNLLTLLRKQANITATMLTDAITGLLEVNPQFAQDCIKREQRSDSLYFFITRLMFSLQETHVGHDRLRKTFSPASIRLITKNLERIADCAEYLAKLTLHLDANRDILDRDELKTMAGIFHSIQTLYNMAIDALFSGNVAVASDAGDLRRRIDAELWNQIPQMKMPYAPAISIMMAMIAENSVSIAGEAINIIISKTTSYPLS
jgi:phosphate uptake regulator